MPRMILMFKDKVMGQYPLSDQAALTIGRRSDNDIVIDNLAVSGHHARIEINGEVVMLADLGSKNGTFVNTAAVTNAQLSDGDAVTVGKHTLVADLSDSMSVTISNEPVATPSMAGGALNADQTMMMDSERYVREQGQATIADDHPAADSLVDLSGAQEPLTLVNALTTIGRNTDADFVISGFWAFLAGQPAATINKSAGQYVLGYAGGLFKPKVNGLAVKGSVRLKDRDVIQVGPLRLELQLSARAGD